MNDKNKAWVDLDDCGLQTVERVERERKAAEDARKRAEEARRIAEEARECQRRFEAQQAAERIRLREQEEKHRRMREEDERDSILKRRIAQTETGEFERREEVKLEDHKIVVEMLRANQEEEKARGREAGLRGRPAPPPAPTPAPVGGTTQTPGAPPPPFDETAFRREVERRKRKEKNDVAMDQLDEASQFQQDVVSRAIENARKIYHDEGKTADERFDRIRRMLESYKVDTNVLPQAMREFMEENEEDPDTQ